jgi:hypothetical protein
MQRPQTAGFVQVPSYKLRRDPGVKWKLWNSGQADYDSYSCLYKNSFSRYTSNQYYLTFPNVAKVVCIECSVNASLLKLPRSAIFTSAFSFRSANPALKEAPADAAAVNATNDVHRRQVMTSQATQNALLLSHHHAKRLSPCGSALINTCSAIRPQAAQTILF